jgi:hypothetical protein
VRAAGPREALEAIVGRQDATDALTVRMRVQDGSVQWTQGADAPAGGSLVARDSTAQRPGVWRGVLKGAVDLSFRRGPLAGLSEGLAYADKGGRLVLALGVPSESRPGERGPRGFDGAVKLVVLERGSASGAAHASEWPWPRPLHEVSAEEKEEEKPAEAQAARGGALVGQRGGEEGWEGPLGREERKPGGGKPRAGRGGGGFGEEGRAVPEGERGTDRAGAGGFSRASRGEEPSEDGAEEGQAEDDAFGQVEPGAEGQGSADRRRARGDARQAAGQRGRGGAGRGYDGGDAGGPGSRPGRGQRPWPGVHSSPEEEEEGASAPGASAGEEDGSDGAGMRQGARRGAAASAGAGEEPAEPAAEEVASEETSEAEDAGSEQQLVEVCGCCLSGSGAGATPQLRSKAASCCALLDEDPQQARPACAQILRQAAGGKLGGAAKQLVRAGAGVAEEQTGAGRGAGAGRGQGPAGRRGGRGGAANRPKGGRGRRERCVFDPPPPPLAPPACNDGARTVA